MLSMTDLFVQGVKELCVSLFQAVVLLLFNEVDTKGLTYTEIKQLCGIGQFTLLVFYLCAGY